MAVLSLGACTSSVVVDSDFPTPLVEPAPLSIGLLYDPELRDFIHAEALPRGATWTIDLGDANLGMLEPVFNSLFSSTREVESAPPNTPAGIDAVLMSSLDRFEFDVPRETRDEFAEVWLQYRLQLFDSDGDEIVNWPVSGYGKAEVQHDRETAVHDAAIHAIREAGAEISIRFLEQPDVQYWLQERNNARQSTAGL